MGAFGAERQLWARVDHLRRIAERLVEDGFVCRDDEEACFELLISEAEARGELSRWSVQRLRNQSRNSRTEQKRIVDEYLAFSRKAKDEAQRTAKRQALGVTHNELCHYTRRIYGARTLSSVRGRPAIEHVMDVLRDRPWQDIRELYGALGGTLMAAQTVKNACDRGTKRGLLKRRRRGPRHWEYACAS